MINIAILDDDKAALLISKGAIEAFFQNKSIPFHVDVFQNPSAFLANATETEYELLFLDIDMPVLNGLEVGKKIKDISPEIVIIFLSKREDLVFDCLSLHPFGFIRKSKIIDDFEKIMELYFNSVYNLGNKGTNISIESKTGITSIRIEEIMYIEGNRNYQIFHLKDNKSLRIRILMNDLETKLNPYGFIRIQKGFLVNYLFIRKIGCNQVDLSDGKALPISSKRKDDILSRYLKITRENKAVFFD